MDSVAQFAGGFAVSELASLIIAPIDIPAAATITVVAMTLACAALFSLSLVIFRLFSRAELTQRSRILTTVLGAVAFGIPAVATYAFDDPHIARAMLVVSATLVILAPFAAMKRVRGT